MLVEGYEDYYLNSNEPIGVINNLLDDQQDAKIVRDILQKQIDKEKEKQEQNQLENKQYQEKIIPLKQKLSELESQIFELFGALNKNNSLYKATLNTLSTDEFNSLVSYLKSIGCIVIPDFNQKLTFLHLFNDKHEEQRVKISKSLFSTLPSDIKIKKNKDFDLRDFLNHKVKINEQFFNFKSFTQRYNLSFSFILDNYSYLEPLIVRNNIERF